MSIIIHDKIEPANNTFKVIDTHHIGIKDKEGSLADHMFTVIYYSDYKRLERENKLNPLTPYLIIEDPPKEEE